MRGSAWAIRCRGNRRRQGRFTDGFINGTMVLAVGYGHFGCRQEQRPAGGPYHFFSKSVIDGISAPISASPWVWVYLPAKRGIFVGRAHRPSASCSHPLGTDVIGGDQPIGSLLLLAISLNMLGLTKIRLMNLVPAMLFSPFCCADLWILRVVPRGLPLSFFYWELFPYSI